MRRPNKKGRNLLIAGAPELLAAALLLPLGMHAVAAKHLVEMGLVLGASALLLKTLFLGGESVRTANDGREFAGSSDAILWEADNRTLRFTSVRGQVKRILGYPAERWLGDPDFFAIHIYPEDRKRAISTVRAAEAECELTYRAESSEGKVVWLANRFQLVRDSKGRPRKLAGRITRMAATSRPAKTTGGSDEALGREHIEERLRQSQKMEAMGQLAGGVAHDFNNILTVIEGYCDLLLAGIEKSHPSRRHAEEIKKAGERAASLTRQLLAFSRRQPVEPRVVDLNAVVANVEKMLRRLIGEDIELSTVREPQSRNVKADVGQLEQLLMNLAVNARDAMPDGGKLVLETSEAELFEPELRTGEQVRPGRYVRLAVSDTGCGMDAETQQHIFEPFFTTKEKGTGLGLATVYGIVKQNGGYIWVSSEVDYGTTFRIYLPCVEEEETVAVPGLGEGHRRPSRGSETVLVVEDEGTVRRLVRGVLQGYGYQVLEASQGEDALRLARRHSGAIHLCLTDVVMPHMNGCQLAERLTSARPETRVLYMSGYTEQALAAVHNVQEPVGPYLEKPFHPALLARKVREVLDAPARLMHPAREVFA